MKTATTMMSLKPNIGEFILIQSHTFLYKVLSLQSHGCLQPICVIINVFDAQLDPDAD